MSIEREKTEEEILADEIEAANEAAAWEQKRQELRAEVAKTYVDATDVHNGNGVSQIRLAKLILEVAYFLLDNAVRKI